MFSEFTTPNSMLKYKKKKYCYRQELMNRDIAETKLRSDLTNSEITIADLKQEIQVQV